MNIIRVLLFGIFLWLMFFLEYTTAKYALDLDSFLYYLTHFFVLAVVIVIAGLIYFNDKTVARGGLEGFTVGLTFVVILIVLDAIITAPFIVNDFLFIINTPILWINWIEVVIVSSAVGSFMKHLSPKYYGSEPDHFEIFEENSDGIIRQKSAN